MEADAMDRAPLAASSFPIRACFNAGDVASVAGDMLSVSIHRSCMALFLGAAMSIFQYIHTGREVRYGR
jgi:hypothetical protein